MDAGNLPRIRRPGRRVRPEIRRPAKVDSAVTRILPGYGNGRRPERWPAYAASTAAPLALAVRGRLNKAPTYRAATIRSRALIPVTNVTDCKRPPTSAPIRLAPSAASFRSTSANDRTNTIPLKSIGRLVNSPTTTALVAYG